MHPVQFNKHLHVPPEQISKRLDEQIDSLKLVTSGETQLCVNANTKKIIDPIANRAIGSFASALDRWLHCNIFKNLVRKIISWWQNYSKCHLCDGLDFIKNNLGEIDNDLRKISFKALKPLGGQELIDKVNDMQSIIK